MISSLLSEFHERLNWPEPEHILDPPGAGPAYYGRLARLKIGKPLSRKMGEDQVRVGVLTGNSSGSGADAPIALICEFAKPLTQGELNETRRLAWNFCRSPLLITLEPHLVRSWSCFEKPEPSGRFASTPIITGGDGVSLDLGALTDTLHWMRLASGHFLARYRDRFDRNQRADTTLLENLRYVRERLVETKDTDGAGKFQYARGRSTSYLPEDIAHDLLARIIFVQFLFHRKDSRGNAALNTRKLETLRREGVLSHSYEDLQAILRHKSDMFALFQWLNTKFNGDLFPESYSEEERHVKKAHLDLLADFVSGQLQMENGQYLLWPQYSFDTIPLEFVSSIYEEFVTNRGDGTGIGEHYTRPFLVDFMLDKVLPWSGENHELRILDPCCGSAVFLVKTFQRLVQRWRSANPGKEPPASVLRELLEKNIFGVDIDQTKNAIRVSSFSLYLAMCDEIDPKHYWTQVHFPHLREVTLRTADFFAEDVRGINTENDKQTYDLVIGNAPWGKQSLTEEARKWADENGITPVDEQSGTLFLAKAAKLCKPSGHICMIQPTGSLLFNVSPTALEFRKKFFTDYKVNEIVNLSAIRFLDIFPKAVGPACIINMRSTRPDGEPIAYWSPKQTNTDAEQYRIVVDAQDLNWVWPEEAAEDPVVWPALMWGGRRDFEFVLRVRNRHYTLAKGMEKGEWQLQRGFQRGTTEAIKHDTLLNKPILEITISDDKKKKTWDIWDSLPRIVGISRFPENKNALFAYPKPLSTYRLPVMILKNSWTVTGQRFEAKTVISDKRLNDQNENHLLYSQSFFGVRHEDYDKIAALTILANSEFAVYFFYLISGRLASYRPTIRMKDFVQIPLPPQSNVTLDEVARMGEREIDERTLELFRASEVERALIDDFINVTLVDFKEPENSSGREFVWTGNTETDARLENYCEWFLKVLKSGFGEDKPICASIFAHESNTAFPFCLVGIHLDWPDRAPVCYERIGDDNLLSKIMELDQAFQRQTDGNETIFYRRVSRIYQTIRVKDRSVPTVFLIKPNQVRYWTRSAALRDADEVAFDLVRWKESGAMEKGLK